MQIALYARVSTTRQAENDLSIPDQLRQMRQWAERNGHIVVKEYIEPGASATDDRRPMFQTMISDAMLKPAPFQMIVVHSFSRFFRDLVEGAMYQRRLMKAGIRLESITQHTSDDSAGQMQRHMIMLFDEYQSKEIAKHVLRGMQENARQGYFNGARPPFGYKTIIVGQTGAQGRIKKKLEIDDSEAAIVRDIFAWYVHGKDGQPRMGAKDIAKHLNASGVPLRGKRVWGSGIILQILASPTYAGCHHFNQMNAKTGHRKDKSEWIGIQVPAIIDQDLFDKAVALREANSPKQCAPRRETSPVLLTGLLRCGHCGSAMTLATGKSGRYRYYKCVARMKRGNPACPSGNIPVEKMDALILDAFKRRVYTPEHMRGIIEELRRQRAKTENFDEKQQIKRLEKELAETEQAQARLYDAIEKGLIEQDEQLKGRFQQNKTRREGLLFEIAALKRQRQSPLQDITPQKIEAVSKLLAEKLSENTPLAKAYLKATVSEIRVTDDLVSLSGQGKALAQLIAAKGKIDGASSVPGFRGEWWAIGGSNSGPGD